MADIFTKSKRSEVMSKIRSKNTKLDRAMAGILEKSGIPFKQYPRIFGNPDFLVRNKMAVFCDGSFWHGRNWSKLRIKLEQGNNSDYWISHISKNRRRDQTVNRKLRNEGFVVVRFWDTDIFKRPEWCIKEIRKRLG